MRKIYILSLLLISVIANSQTTQELDEIMKHLNKTNVTTNILYNTDEIKDVKQFKYYVAPYL